MQWRGGQCYWKVCKCAHISPVLISNYNEGEDKLGNILFLLSAGTFISLFIFVKSHRVWRKERYLTIQDFLQRYSFSSMTKNWLILHTVECMEVANINPPPVCRAYYRILEFSPPNLQSLTAWLDYCIWLTENGLCMLLISTYKPSTKRLVKVQSCCNQQFYMECSYSYIRLQVSPIRPAYILTDLKSKGYQVSLLAYWMLSHISAIIPTLTFFSFFLA